MTTMSLTLGPHCLGHNRQRLPGNVHACRPDEAAILRRAPGLSRNAGSRLGGWEL